MEMTPEQKAEDMINMFVRTACKSNMTDPNIILSTDFWDTIVSDDNKRAYELAFFMTGKYFKHAALIINCRNRYELLVSQYNIKTEELDLVKSFSGKPYLL